MYSYMYVSAHCKILAQYDVVMIPSLTVFDLMEYILGQFTQITQWNLGVSLYHSLKSIDMQVSVKY